MAARCKRRARDYFGAGSAAGTAPSGERERDPLKKVSDWDGSTRREY